ncbi:MAG: glycosyltransferase family 39 protein [Pirellulales bacterium]|nr:glycosyltransferase family 39 protein [Pirellulales bacterium]
MSLATAPVESCPRAVDEYRSATSQRNVQSPRAWRLFVLLNVVALLGTALWFRVWELGHLPGINGDEAEYAVRAVRLLQGEPIVWHTPTGNVVNPFFFFPQVAIHAIWPPSFVTLRLIAVVSGLTALVLNYLLCRRLLGDTAAWISTSILAVLPIDIAYSRFAWDTCQTLAASTLVVYPALLMLAEPARRWRWFALACVGYGAAYLVHPTNVFLGGFLVAVPLVERRHEWQARVRSFGPWKTGFAAIGVVLLAAFASWFGRTVLSIGRIDATSPAGLGEFARNYGRLFQGTTIYRYIAGSHGAETITSPAWPYDFGWLDGLTLALFAGSAVLVGLELRRKNDAADWGLLAGWLATTGGFLLVAGPEAIRPHWERYGLCLLLPGVLLVTRASALLLRPGRSGRLATVALLALAWLMLADFHASYFHFMHQTGGESQQTFRTAAVEPKQAVLDRILTRHQSGAPAQIVAGEWWNYWPLAYLASDDREISVVWEADDNRPSDERWYVDFADSEAHLQHRRELADRWEDVVESSVLDYAGRPILVLLERGRMATGAARDTSSPGASP